MRTNAVQHPPFFDSDVRSAVARWYRNNEEASSSISLAWHSEQLNAERFVNAIPGGLHRLLLGCVKSLLMQGRGAVCLVGTYAEDQNTTADVGQGTEVVSQVIHVVKLPLEVKVPGLASPLVNQPLDARQSVHVGWDAEPGEEGIHSQPR